MERKKPSARFGYLAFLYGSVKGNCWLFNLLIGVEGAKTPAGVRGWGDPTGASAPRRLPGTPAES
jgi:hypothetical protein